ncbi:MAG TPA: hypothetical protein VF808_08980 [Ktedonobacterales bacterium]
MAIQVVIHLTNDEPFTAEMEDLPPPGATYVMLTNPRTREGKHVQWVTAGAYRFMYPLTRISFIEIMMSAQDRDIEPFYRDRGAGGR